LLPLNKLSQMESLFVLKIAKQWGSFETEQ
jgi:hypothetical protein